MIVLVVAYLAGYGNVSFAVEKSYNFTKLRTDYRLDLTAEGTAVVDKATGETIVVPFGERMTFKGALKYSKDTQYIIHRVRSHAEVYIPMEESAELPVDFLRTAFYNTWDDKTPQESIRDRFNTPIRFPDKSDKVVTAYVNMTEYSNIGNADAAFDPSWDKDNDAIIDADAENLPDYVDPRVFNAPWKNYVAKYWTESWRMVLAKRIDYAAAQHFDGIMLDVPDGVWPWKEAYPELDYQELRKLNNELLQWISNYAKEQYGTAFLITGNFGGAAYFADFGKNVDGAYAQNFFFSWDGSGIINGYGLSQSEGEFKNVVVDFYRKQGVQMLDMEHLGTGEITEGLDFVDYDDRITQENLLHLFRWAIDSGSTPFVSQVFMSRPYNGIPRFSRIIAGMPPFADTPYDDWVLGSDEEDVFATGAGDDLVYGGPGDDEIYGGSGNNDRVFFTGKRSDYDVITDKGVTTVISKNGNEDTDILIGFESLIFSDTTEKIPAYDISFSDVPDTAWFYRAVSYITAKGISAGPASDTFRPADKLTRGDFLVMLMKAYGIGPDENSEDNFTDAGNTYYTGYLAAAKRMGLTGGAGNNMYLPENQITRQDMFTLLFRVLEKIDKLPQGSSGETLADFSDSGQIASYAMEAMNLLVETGAITGSGGKLNPTGTTTRAEMAQVLYNLLLR